VIYTKKKKKKLKKNLIELIRKLYIKTIKAKEKELEALLKQLTFDTIQRKDIFIPMSDKRWPYWDSFHRLTGQINILYQILTAHDNKYGEKK